MPSLPDIGSSLPEVALRTAIVYVFLVVAIRVTGKREVGQMSVLELVVILIISDAVQNSMVGENTSVWSGLVAVTVLLTLDIVLHALTGRSRRARRAIEGEPRLLVRDGRVLDHAMRDPAQLRYRRWLGLSPARYGHVAVQEAEDPPERVAPVLAPFPAMALVVVPIDLVDLVLDPERLVPRGRARPRDRHLVRLYRHHHRAWAGARRLAHRSCIVALGFSAQLAARRDRAVAGAHTRA